MGEGPLCTLTDCVASFSDDGPRTPVPGSVDTVAELIRLLRAAAAGPPRRFNMELPGNVRVTIGIGGPWAAISWHHLFFGQALPPHHPPSWHARAERPPAIAGVAFRLSVREDDIPAERLLPADEVIRMAAYIAEHRALPAWGWWEDAAGNRYAGGARAGAADGPAVDPDSVIPF